MASWRRRCATRCGPPGRRASRNGRWCCRSSWRCDMPSFDIVSKVNEQEVDNAFQQAKKEIDQRYDFKGTETTIDKLDKEQALRLRANSEDRLEAAREIVVQKLAKRGISLR